MPHAVRPAAFLLLAIGLLLALGACATGGDGSSELTPDESPVPDGMPVMYEFYTTT